MVDLPKKKVGIVACSCEELPEGAVTRQAALQVLENLRPADTVTICLPLFLAGGEGDRAFARFYPTITVDGCELFCARRATEKYSSKPAASLMVRELIAEKGIRRPQGRSKLDDAGRQAAELTAQRIAGLVDELLEKRWNRRSGDFIEMESIQVVKNDTEEAGKVAACSCGSGIPIQKVIVDGKTVTLVGLPLIFQQFREAGKAPGDATLGELMDTIKIYNPIPVEYEPAYRQAILVEYEIFWGKEIAR